VAAALAARIRRDRLAIVAGPVLSVPGAAGLLARVVADRPAWRELRRQAQGFRVACFCPSPATRDATVAAIDTAMAGQWFIQLPDGSAGRVVFTGTTTLDDARDAALFRRDLTYSVEYATTAQEIQAAMLFGSASLGATFYTN
jgi:DNA-binding NarL/FixJ family response regulator